MIDRCKEVIGGPELSDLVKAPGGIVYELNPNQQRISTLHTRQNKAT